MGMAASQVRLLQLTNRKNTIGRELSCLSLEKNSLSRDMNRVSLEYQNALNTKTLKWTNNSGVSYVDLSYKNLMTPNTTNGNIPYLLTNSNGQVVLNGKYVEYAKMISPTGAAGGDWESNRTSILSELTGIPAEKIENSVNTQAAKDESDKKVNELKAEVDKAKSDCTKKTLASDFIQYFGSLTSTFNTSGTDACSIIDDYKKAKEWSLGNSVNTAKISVETLLNTIKSSVKNYLFDEDYAKFETACQQTQQIYNDYLSSQLNNIADLPARKDDAGEYYIDAKSFIDTLLKNYINAGGGITHNSSNENVIYYNCTDKTGDGYKDYEAKKAALDEALAENSNLVDTNNQALTSTEESQILFYDQLFNSIVDNGWVGDLEVEDSEYLNNMLQNNQYYITTIKNYTDCEGKDYSEYDTHIASNFDYIVSVNDKAVQTEAQAKYEYEKSIISEKESRLDTRMQDLETEQSAINEMIKGIESVRDENTERTFSIFS